MIITTQEHESSNIINDRQWAAVKCNTCTYIHYVIMA